jgi:hypothetical protein
MTMLSSNLCLRCVSSSEEASAAKGLQGSSTFQKGDGTEAGGS